MTEKLFSTFEAAQMVGVSEFRLAYAHRAGHLAEPTYRITNKRIYTEADLERVARYFDGRKPRQPHEEGDDEQ